MHYYNMCMHVPYSVPCSVCPAVLTCVWTHGCVHTHALTCNVLSPPTCKPGSSSPGPPPPARPRRRPPRPAPLRAPPPTQGPGPPCGPGRHHVAEAPLPQQHTAPGCWSRKQRIAPRAAPSVTARPRLTLPRGSWAAASRPPPPQTNPTRPDLLIQRLTLRLDVRLYGHLRRQRPQLRQVRLQRRRCHRQCNFRNRDSDTHDNTTGDLDGSPAAGRGVVAAAWQLCCSS